MSKINVRKLNINLGFALLILAILALFMFVMPKESQARTYGRECTSVGCNYNYETAPGVNNNPYTYQNPIVFPTYSYTTTPTVYSSTATGTTTTVKKTSTTTAKKTTTPKTGEVAGTSDESDLAASVIYGEDSFLPSGLIQWIIVAILILLIIILSRKLFGGEKRYHEEPLKHA